MHLFCGVRKRKEIHASIINKVYGKVGKNGRIEELIDSRIDIIRNSSFIIHKSFVPLQRIAKNK